MRIDLRNANGLLKRQAFSTVVSRKAKEPTPVPEDDTDVVESLARRMAQQRAAQPTHSKPKAQAVGPARKKSSRLSRFLFVVMVLSIVLLLWDRGYLDPSIEWVTQKLGVVSEVDTVVTITPKPVPAAGTSGSYLSDDDFNELMPLTPDIIALRDSLARLGLNVASTEAVERQHDSLQATPVEDTIALSETVRLADHSQTAPTTEPEPQEPALDLSDLDVEILHNHSLELMMVRLMREMPTRAGITRLDLDREGMQLRVENPGLSKPVVEAILAEFTLGKLSSPPAGSAGEFSSTFDLVLPPVRHFRVDRRGSAEAILDLLVHPFYANLTRIVADLEQGLNNNPIRIEMNGQLAELADILAVWSEYTLNYILVDARLEAKGSSYSLTLNVRLIPYTL